MEVSGAPRVSGYYLENLYKGLKALLNLYKGLICNNFYLHSKRVLRRYHFHLALPKTQIEGSSSHFTDWIPRLGIPVGDISMAQHFQGSLLSTSPPSWLIGRENYLPSRLGISIDKNQYISSIYMYLEGTFIGWHMGAPFIINLWQQFRGQEAGGHGVGSL